MHRKLVETVAGKELLMQEPGPLSSRLRLEQRSVQTLLTLRMFALHAELVLDQK